MHLFHWLILTVFFCCNELKTMSISFQRVLSFLEHHRGWGWSWGPLNSAVAIRREGSLWTEWTILLFSLWFQIQFVKNIKNTIKRSTLHPNILWKYLPDELSFWPGCFPEFMCSFDLFLCDTRERVSGQPCSNCEPNISQGQHTVASFNGHMCYYPYNSSIVLPYLMENSQFCEAICSRRMCS